MQKKIVIVFFLIIIVAVVRIGYFNNRSKNAEHLPDNKKILNNFIIYNIEDRDYRFLVADSEAGQRIGLSNIDKLENADGMIFLFSDKDIRTFWNKNTFLDLKVYWIEDDKIIGTADLPSIKGSKKIVKVVSPGRVDKVVELVEKH